MLLRGKIANLGRIGALKGILEEGQEIGSLEQKSSI